jgi:decaprenylphospho-beta-D-ribofuranose 2-oxidase
VNPKVFVLLDELDEVVSEYGGRLYLAKDARMNADFFHKSYPKIVSSGVFQSAQSKRLAF